MTAETKINAACCARFYEQDWVQALLGDSFHPGGIELTRRLVSSLGIEAGDRVLDVACGIGTTALMIANEFGGNVTGLDYSSANVTRASGKAISENTAAHFVEGSATHLPFAPESFDHLICECAFSTFDDQATASEAFYRVLRNGGTVAISDMVLTTAIPQRIGQLVESWTCLAAARDLAGYQRLLMDAGFAVVSHENESEALLEMIVELKRKLLVAGFGKTLATANGVPDVLADLNIADLRTLIDEARQLAVDGVVQYWRMIFAKVQPKLT